jgi:hypothetical protein
MLQSGWAERIVFARSVMISLFLVLEV